MKIPGTERIKLVNCFKTNRFKRQNTFQFSTNVPIRYLNNTCDASYVSIFQRCRTRAMQIYMKWIGTWLNLNEILDSTAIINSMSIRRMGSRSNRLESQGKILHTLQTTNIPGCRNTSNKFVISS